VQANQLQNALKHLSDAIQETESVLEKMRADSDPLASHIFVSRRQYRNMSDTKSSKRSERALRVSWQIACELGFRGNLGEWERLMGAASKR
jgi:chromosome segregation ATPase